MTKRARLDPLEEPNKDDQVETSSSEEDEPKDPIESETETDSDAENEQTSKNGSESVALTVLGTAEKAKKKEAAQPSVTLGLALPTVRSGTKRPSERTSRDGESKRAKKVTSRDDDVMKMEEDTKKPLFQRIWSEEDEIAVLQGMIDFKAETGKSPYEDKNGYYDSIRKSISFEVSKNQFLEKIRSLKKKYFDKAKGSYDKPHDQKAFKLCKYIWGCEGMGLQSAIKSNGVSKKKNHGGEGESSVADWFENSFLVRSIAGFGVDERCVKQRWSLVPAENKEKTKEEWKALQAKEFDIVLQKTAFLHHVAAMIQETFTKEPFDI